MKNHFLLIYPPTYTRALDLPIGGLYLAHSLLKSDFDINIINEFDYEDIISSIDRSVSDTTVAFGLSVVSGRVIDDALKIAKYLRNTYPGRPIIWGGPHPSALPEQTLESNLVDYVIAGEGENGSITGLLMDF